MKFKFSLEPVLEVRKHKETIQKQKLAEKLTKKRKLSELRDQLKEKLKENLAKADQEDFSNLHDLKRYQQYINDLHQKVGELNSNLEVIKKAVDKQRDKLAEVHKKRHIMEKIKEEEHELFLEQVSKQERKTMDEVATQTHTQ